MSFTEAAIELHISQSAVSHQIKSLEDWIGFKLFERASSRLTLTANGKIYAEALAGCFSRIGAATRELIATGTNQILHLRGQASFFAQWLIPRLAGFQSEHPDIRLQLVSNAEPADFRQDHPDMSIMYGDGDVAAMRSDLIFSDELLPVISPRLAATMDTPCTLEQLFALPFIHSRVDDQWNSWINALVATRNPTGHDLIAEDASILYRYALAGLGVALTQYRYAYPDLKEGRIVAPHPFILRRSSGYHLVCQAERAGEEKISRFRHWLLAQGAVHDKEIT